jgi:hypothetical protein
MKKLTYTPTRNDVFKPRIEQYPAVPVRVWSGCGGGDVTYFISMQI